MLEYNDTSIISGFIKQYLKSFNLPSLKVYNENELMIKDQYYIKDKMLVKCKNYTRNPQESDYEKIQDYHYNSKYLNLTKKPSISTIRNVLSEQIQMQSLHKDLKSIQQL